MLGGADKDADLPLLSTSASADSILMSLGRACTPAEASAAGYARQLDRTHVSESRLTSERTEGVTLLACT